MSQSDTMKWLRAKYNVLVGETFLGCYDGARTMPQTGNERDVIIVQDRFDATLAEISSDVIQRYGKTVWKGITGPKDKRDYTEFWLWVEPNFSSEPLVGNLNFRIDHCEPFQCSGGTFSHGVSIKVSLA